MRLIIGKYYLFIIINIGIALTQCNYDYGDINNDNFLDVVDVVAFVEFIINEDFDYDVQYDLNFDNIINVVDIIALINRILIDDIFTTNILNIEYDFQDLYLTWSESTDIGFNQYNIYYSNLESNEEIIIYSTQTKSETSVILPSFSLQEQNWFIVGVRDFLGCEQFGEQYLFNLPYKGYDIDSLGNVINHSFDINHFDSAQDCQACHSVHYDEWSQSMHAYTAHSPLFFSYKNNTVENHPDVGDKFCTQCHNPAAYLTNTDLSSFESVEDFQSSDLAPVIKEGISCDICHTVTGLSGTTYTPDNGSASAIYKLYPGENIKFGPLENPEQNSFHESFYLPSYKISEQCLPCHDLVVRDVEAEITFTEWDRIPGFSMFGGIACQECHMPEKEDGTHDHTFIGVDMDLSIPYLENPLFDKVADMLSSSAEIRFEIWNQVLPETISSLDTLSIPLTIESLTAHSIPSGTSFNREAWIEIIVKHNNEVLFSSGYLDNNTQNLDYNDNNLLIFKSYLYDVNGNSTHSVIDVHNIDNQSLQAYSQRFKYYDFLVPEGIDGELNIQARMLFRPFEPEFIIEHHSEFLNNLPIFEMCKVESTVLIQ